MKNWKPQKESLPLNHHHRAAQAAPHQERRNSMETITIYKFKIFYDLDDLEAQERFVVAESEDEAWDKINNHFEMMHREGFAKPVFIADPTVEIDRAII
jgi:hypothetical protein